MYIAKDKTKRKGADCSAPFVLLRLLQQGLRSVIDDRGSDIAPDRFHDVIAVLGIGKNFHEGDGIAVEQEVRGDVEFVAGCSKEEGEDFRHVEGEIIAFLHVDGRFNTTEFLAIGPGNEEEVLLGIGIQIITAGIEDKGRTARRIGKTRERDERKEVLNPFTDNRVAFWLLRGAGVSPLRCDVASRFRCFLGDDVIFANRASCHVKLAVFDISGSDGSGFRNGVCSAEKAFIQTRHINEIDLIGT